MNTVLMLMLMLWFVAFAYAASVGFRGRATHPDYYGARVSDAVKSTPRLRARANRSVGIWCTVGSMMAVVPIVWIGSDFHRERTTWELAGLAAYVFVVVVVVVVVGGLPAGEDQEVGRSEGPTTRMRPSIVLGLR